MIVPRKRRLSRGDQPVRCGADQLQEQNDRNGICLGKRSGGVEARACSVPWIVGRLKDKTHTVDGASFEITQHGFGRDLSGSRSR